MTAELPPSEDAEVQARVQTHVDEIEFLYGSLGEITGYLAYAEHTEQELARNGGASLVPPDPEFWREVAQECRRRDAGVETPYNKARFGLLEE
jgi:hypothetical protein